MAPGPLFTNQHPQNLQHEPNNSTGKKNNLWLSERNVPTSSVMELWPKAKAINEECLVCFWGSRDGFGRVGPKWKNPGTHNTLDWWNRGTRRFWRTLLNHQHHQHLCEPSFTGLPVKKKHGICMHLPPAHQTKTPGNSTRFFASLTICCIFSLS